MKQIMLLLSMVTAFFSLSVSSTTSDYKIKTLDDGPYAIEIGGININDESSLTRQSILFNVPDAPATILSHSTSTIYADRRMLYKGATIIEVHKPIRAIDIRTATYDAFGLHMDNLSNVEVKDFASGKVTLMGTWNSYDDKAAKLLTSVTYIARVRYVDGTQWIFDQDSLYKALGSLKLEKKADQDKPDA